MPTVRVNTMYDLKTGSKFGLIGIHTPTTGQLGIRYDGLFRNYKYVKVKRCNIKMACAQMLPADPLQVGVESGKISPADMMNPILFRPVSNESWNVVVNRIYSGFTWDGDSASGLDDAFVGLNQTGSERVYYSLLASKEWRKVMPQQGLVAKDLRPLVHEVVSTFGNVGLLDNSSNGLGVAYGTGTGGNPSVFTGGTSSPVTFKGRTMPMPAIPTVSVNSTGETPVVTTLPVIPRTYVMAICLPPSSLQSFFYRLIVSWEVVFFGLRPATEYSITTMNQDGQYVRYSRWESGAAKELENTDEASVDEVGNLSTINMSPQLVMEQ